MDDTLEHSDPASLGAGDEQVLVFVLPKPESQNISFSRISLGRESNPSESKLEEDWMTLLEDVDLKDDVEELSPNCCCCVDDVEEEVEEEMGALGVASVMAAPSCGKRKVLERWRDTEEETIKEEEYEDGWEGKESKRD